MATPLNDWRRLRASLPRQAQSNDLSRQAKRAVQAASDGEPPPGPFHLFRADVKEVVLVRVGDPADHLVIESWHEGRGLRRVERR